MLTSAAIFATALWLGQVTPSLELRAETGGGEAPVIPGQEPAGGFAAIIEPQAQLRIGGAINVVTARYGPRVSLRRPNALKVDRPLLLHNAGLAADLRPTVGSSVRFTSRLSVGEPDYTALQALFGPRQGALPEVDEILDLHLGIEAGLRLTQRSTLGIQAEFGHRRLFGDIVVVPDSPLPTAAEPVRLGRQTGVSGGPFFSHRLTSVDTVMVLTDVTYETRDPNLDFFVSFASFGWERRMQRSQTLSLAGGIAYARVKGPGLNATGGQDDDESDDLISPVAALGYAAQLTGPPGAGLGLRGNLSLMNVVDPVINVAGPRGSVDLNLDCGIAPRWVLTGAGTFSTNLAHHERLDVAAVPPDETLMAAALVLRHRPSPSLTFDVGVRWSDRGANLRAPALGLHQRELWGFVSATVIARPARP